MRMWQVDNTQSAVCAALNDFLKDKLLIRHDLT